MKKTAIVLFLLLAALLPACSSADNSPAAATPTHPETVSAPSTQPPEPEATAAPAEPVVLLTGEEETMLLKIGMAERGNTECTECIALVMRTVLNRVEAGRFGRSIRSVLFAPDQFTPIADGSYHSAEPNDHCEEALKMVIYGWDESQGALFYEWCAGESWHSKHLHLLFQHCDTRFYN